MTDIERIANTIILLLKSEGFIIQRYDAITTNSIYLKLDYGVCNSIRISDHQGKKYLKYRYNVVLGSKTHEKYDKYPRFFYGFDTYKKQLIKRILADRESKLEKYGRERYEGFMSHNQRTKNDSKGFWREAKLV